MVVTSPPYWQKRDYGHVDQIGLESTPAGYVSAIMRCLEEWRRVLRPSGSVFLNVGDTYHKRSLVGIPGRIEAAAVDSGWLVRNRIIWAKDGGMPEPGKGPPRRSARVRHPPCPAGLLLLRPAGLRRDCRRRERREPW